jgi:hypothetical protein
LKTQFDWCILYENMGQAQEGDLTRRRFIRTGLGVGGAVLLWGIAASLDGGVQVQRSLISEEETQRLIDQLWSETQAKHVRGVESFPWPQQQIEDLWGLNDTQRIDVYAKSLQRVWDKRDEFWTPYDELSWQSQTGQNSAGRPLSKSQEFWNRAAIADVSHSLDYIRKPNFVPNPLEEIHFKVLGEHLNSGVQEVHERILGRTLQMVSPVQDSTLTVQTLTQRLNDTVLTLYSLPRFSHMEASIVEPLTYPDPYKPVIGMP